MTETSEPRYELAAAYGERWTRDRHELHCRDCGWYRELKDYGWHMDELRDALQGHRKAVHPELFNPPVTEHAREMSGGGMHIRAAGLDDVYPLAEWIEHGQRNGGRVWRRRIQVIEDWVEVPRG